MNLFGHQKIRKQWLISIMVLCVGVLIVLGLLFIKPRAIANPKQEKQWSVDTFIVSDPNDYAPELRLYGRVKHSRLTQLSSPFATDVSQVLVHEGDTVNEGQLLVQLSDTDVALALRMNQLDLEHMQADVAEQKANIVKIDQHLKHQQQLLDLVSSSLERYQTLHDQTYVSQEDLDKKQHEYELRLAEYNSTQHDKTLATLQLHQLQAKEKKLHHQVANDQIQVNDCRIVAPEGGVITQLPVSKGEQVQSGQLVAEVMPSQEREVYALVPNSKVNEVKRALAVNTALPATANVGEFPIQLNLVRMAQQIQSGQVGQQAIFVITQGDEHVVLGQHVSMTLALNPITDTFLVPEAAVYHDNQVYVINHDRLKAVPVTVKGWQYDGLARSTIVQSDQLASGDTILNQALSQAVNGLWVSTAMPTSRKDTSWQDDQS